MMKTRFSICILCLLGIASTAMGATRRVPSEFPYIQSAINASDDGDVVLVANGTYSGAVNTNLHFDGRSITVQSENGPGLLHHRLFAERPCIPVRQWRNAIGGG